MINIVRERIVCGYMESFESRTVGEGTRVDAAPSRKGGAGDANGAECGPETLKVASHCGRGRRTSSGTGCFRIQGILCGCRGCHA
jgi:hypothetical protein